MIMFSIVTIICVVIGYIIACKWEKSSYITDKVVVMIPAAVIGMSLGLALSFWGGSFVKKEIVVEKYFISPMIIDGKPVVALVENNSSYVLLIKDRNKTKLIKHNLYEKEVFFTGDSEERYLEIKRRKTCRENIWIWFFYGGTGLIESKAVFKKGDNFLTLPRYYSL